MVLNRIKQKIRSDGLLECILQNILYHSSDDPSFQIEPIILFLVDDEFPRLISVGLIIYGYVEEQVHMYLHCPFMLILNNVECLKGRPFAEKFFLSHILVKTWLYMSRNNTYDLSLEVWMIEINIIQYVQLLASNNKTEFFVN